MRWHEEADVYFVAGGERIYVNGAVLRVDRKVTLELINDVAFLLEGQVMQVADATTPLRQLYFVVQLMLMSPHDIEEAKAVYREQRCAIVAVVRKCRRCCAAWKRSKSWSKRNDTMMP